MDNKTYKAICKKDNIFSRRILEETIEIVSKANQTLAQKLKRTLEQTPVTKPTKHSGSRINDYFKVELNNADLESVFDCMCGEEGSLANEDSPPSSELARASDLVDLWNHHLWDNLE